MELDLIEAVRLQHVFLIAAWIEALVARFLADFLNCLGRDRRLKLASATLAVHRLRLVASKFSVALPLYTLVPQRCNDADWASLIVRSELLFDLAGASGRDRVISIDRCL